MEFQQLSPYHQGILLQKNILCALALFGARFESMTSVEDQFEFVFNESDRKIWNENFSRVVSKNEVKIINMKKQCDERQILSNEDYVVFKNSSLRLSKLVQDETAFMILRDKLILRQRTVAISRIFSMKWQIYKIIRLLNITMNIKNLN